MKNRFEKIIGFISVLVIVTYTLPSTAQTSGGSYADTLFNQLDDYSDDSMIRKISSNEIEWLQIDTFTIQYYNSALRGHGPMLDTLVISLKLENGWDSQRVKQIKNTNQKLIDELSEVYRNYMDSIDWKGYKITRNSFESNVVMHLKMKYPIKFTESEGLKVDQITRCPDFIHNGIGIFLNCNNPGIKEDDIRESYQAKLEYISTVIYKLGEVNYGRETY
jgi:hypothetical protein